MYLQNFFVSVRTLLQLFCVVILIFSQASEGSNKVSASSSHDFTINDVFAVNSAKAETLSPNGKWVAVSISSSRDLLGVNNHRYGDPSYFPDVKSQLVVINTKTGKQQQVFSSKKVIGRQDDWRASRGMVWSPDSTRLAIAVKESDGFTVKIYHQSTGEVSELALPSNRELAWFQRAFIQWSPNGKTLYLPLRPEGWREKVQARFNQLVRGPIAVYSSEEPLLAWEELKRENIHYEVVAYNLDSGDVRTVLPELISSEFYITGDGKNIVYLQDVVKKTDYSDPSSSFPEFFSTPSVVKIRSLQGGDARTLLATTRHLALQWSSDHSHYAYSTRDGDIYLGATTDGEANLLAKSSPDDGGPLGLVKVNADGSQILVKNQKGLWLINGQNGQRRLFLEMPAEDESAPVYKVVAWSRDGDDIYLNYSSRLKWNRGFSRYSLSSGKLVSLVRSERLYGDLEDYSLDQMVLLSGDNSTLVFASAKGNRPFNIYALNPDRKKVVQLTDANPQLANKILADTELITYLDADGKKLHGVLYYPVDYQPGVKYPTVFILYETFFDNVFDATINLLTSQGYAVVSPSVNKIKGYPQEGWIKGVTAAANMLVERGITDAERMGVHGTSFGGYATNLLITQTDRFKAAINIAGVVNVISLLTESPRFGVRNMWMQSAESGQGRIGGTMWEEPHKYIDNSSVMFADRITTPLLVITGGQDHNITAHHTMQMYYALRRLGKRVEWVNYLNGGHGVPNTTETDARDYYERIVGWYNRYLKKL